MSTPEPTPGLVTWLRGVLDEDEVLARRASTISPAPWRVDLDIGTIRDAHGAGVSGHWRALPALAGAVAPDHIVRHDPASVLPDIAAKRAILALHHGDFPYNLDDGPGDFAWTEQCQACGQVTPCRTLRLLASAYRHRRGYRDEWAPTTG